MADTIEAAGSGALAVEGVPVRRARFWSRLRGRGRAPSECECRWGHARCILFRFGLVYYVLYFLPFPLTALGGVGMLGAPLRWFAALIWQANQWYETHVVQRATVWFGYSVLKLEPRS